MPNRRNFPESHKEYDAKILKAKLQGAHCMIFCQAKLCTTSTVQPRCISTSFKTNDFYVQLKYSVPQTIAMDICQIPITISEIGIYFFELPAK